MRVELFGDTIDSLRWFDVETQRSEEPAGPVDDPADDAVPDLARDAHGARAAAVARLQGSALQARRRREDRAAQENGTFPGIEHYVPVAVEQRHVRRLPRGDWTLALIEPDQITTTIAKYESLLRNEYEAAAEKGRAVYAPEKIVTPGAEILRSLAARGWR